MRSTERRIQNKFLELLEYTPIENITVVLICKELNIKRQTFYYHFQSIYDVIYSIFYIKRIEIDESLNFEKNIGLLQGFFEKNKVLCDGIENSFASDILLEYCSSFVFRLIITLGKATKNINDVAKFFAKPIAQIIIDNYKKEEKSAKVIVESLKRNNHTLLDILS